MNKQVLHLCAVLLFFMFLVSSESIRVLSTKQGEEIRHKKMTNGVIPAAIGKGDDSSINELMGLEACEEGDDECIERRMVSEAHLDYIYTQKSRP